MRIANPIYDVVIKYLLEDIEIAKGFISVLINAQIISLQVKPQEAILQISEDISLMRIDFKAVVLTKNNKYKKVLIEIQKSKSGFQLNRFRRYLGINYMEQDMIHVSVKEGKKEDLPIIAIYILGFEIAGLSAPIIRVERVFKDEISQNTLEKPHKYLEALTHDCLMIQIPKLNNMIPQTELEKVLDVFNEEKYKTDDRHILEYKGDTNDPLVKKMIKRLQRAMLDENLLHQMMVEDEIEQTLADKEKKIKKAEAKAEKAQKAKEEAIKILEEERKAKEYALAEIERLKNELENALKKK
jgi:hypothetical protein